MIPIAVCGVSFKIVGRRLIRVNSNFAKELKKTSPFLRHGCLSLGLLLLCLWSLLEDIAPLTTQKYTLFGFDCVLQPQTD